MIIAYWSKSDVKSICFQSWSSWSM